MDNNFALHQLEVSLEATLGAFVDPNSRTPLDQWSIIKIEYLLEQYPDNRLRQIWSSRPRTYVLFRKVQNIQRNTELCAFIEQKLHDLLLPLPINQLPDAIKSDVELRDCFLRLQLLVLSNPETIVPPPGAGASQAIVETHSHVDDGDAFFHSKQKLGSGGSGFVDSVVCKFTGNEYARKKIPRPSNITLSDQQTLTEFEQELAALKRLRNYKHMVQYIASYTDYKSLAFIMTPIADYDLRVFLESYGPNQDRIADRGLLLEFFGCLATATRTLHGCQIRHMDIKPSNILIKGRTVLFCDFGISRDWSGTSGDTTQGPVYKKTTRYCSPEVNEGQQRNKASDIFSLGVVYLEMISVLGGFTVEAMRTFLRKNGYTDAPCHNLLGVNQWIEELRKVLIEEEAVALQWIGCMVCPLRPHGGL
jgi:tRNA A-37 threonylcarbamoyl transferase component Bud32